jgi:hypothetical protein
MASLSNGVIMRRMWNLHYINSSIHEPDAKSGWSNADVLRLEFVCVHALSYNVRQLLRCGGLPITARLPFLRQRLGLRCARLR